MLMRYEKATNAAKIEHLARYFPSRLPLREDLRAKYETDFPELSDGKLISWSVSYGKVTKQINNPASDKVYTVKAEIEKSKAFTDGLKKAKTDAEKNPECVVKLLKKAQSKGEAVLPSYKDFCLTTQDAELSEKPIVLLPSKDGRIFELRRNEIGEFKGARSPRGRILRYGYIRLFRLCN